MRSLTSQLLQQFPNIQALDSEIKSAVYPGQRDYTPIPIVGEHVYIFTGLNTTAHPLREKALEARHQAVDNLALMFQCGPIPVAGRNGVTIEELLAASIDRLDTFQQSQFACAENELAMSHLRCALMILNGRTSRRQTAGTEGTMQADAPTTYDAAKARDPYTLPPPAARVMWRIEHADGNRFMTLDAIGMPFMTDDPAKALTFGLREHADAFVADCNDDVRIRPC